MTACGISCVARRCRAATALGVPAELANVHEEAEQSAPLTTCSFVFMPPLVRTIGRPSYLYNPRARCRDFCLQGGSVDYDGLGFPTADARPSIRRQKTLLMSRRFRRLSSVLCGPRPSVHHTDATRCESQRRSPLTGKPPAACRGRGDAAAGAQYAHPSAQTSRSVRFLLRPLS